MSINQVYHTWIKRMGELYRQERITLNLVENSEVELQVGADKFVARARTATQAEKPRLWQLMRKIFPQYDRYQAKAGRDIPLVIVEPV